MSNHVFVVSEWLSKEGYDQILWEEFKKLMALSAQEPGCVSAHATRQIPHPGAPSDSKYAIVCLQEYVDLKSFDFHCETEYVKKFIKDFIENKNTGIVSNWQVRLFDENISN